MLQRRQVGKNARAGRRHRQEQEAEARAQRRAAAGGAPEAASDAGTYVNEEPAGVADKGYEPLEADAGDADVIRAEADEYAMVNADEPLDEDVEDAFPTQILVPTATGDVIEEEIAIAPENERAPASNEDQPLARAPDELQPETAGHDVGDEDIEGNWPDEGYYDQDDTPRREG
ncbi:MAG: hypothetical protein IVW36_09710 [Dehalococcoidia bacterium]|nr:hypothetical protein [Dehalococcoidia bacterium]